MPPYDREHHYSENANIGRGTQMRNEVVEPQLYETHARRLNDLHDQLSSFDNSGVERQLQETTRNTLTEVEHNLFDDLPKGEEKHVFTTTQSRPKPMVLQPPDTFVNRGIHEINQNIEDNYSWHKGPLGQDRPPIPGTPWEHHETIHSLQQAHNLQRHLGSYDSPISSNAHVIVPDILPMEDRDLRNAMHHVMKDSPLDRLDGEREHLRNEIKRRKRIEHKGQEKLVLEYEEEEWWNVIYKVATWGGLMMIFFGALYGLGVMSRLITARYGGGGLLANTV